MDSGQPAKDYRQRVTAVLIIGAGPAGLATAACLSAKSISCLILERENCSAPLWKYKSYDRLHLHLPKQYCQLPHFPFPSSYPRYLSCEQFVHYLENYREHFGINPVYNSKVTALEFSSDIGYWRVTAEQKAFGKDVPLKVVRYLARSVVVATGENTDPFTPSFFGEKKFSGEISHSMMYRNGAKYEGKKVLVVGVGNTGMEIALDLANFGAKPTLVARNKLHILPRDLFGFISTFEVSLVLLKRLPLWFVDKIIIFCSRLTLGCTDKYNLVRPSDFGPLEMKERTGHSPVLDVGTVAKIRSGEIKVVPAIDQLTEDGAIFVNGEKEEFDAIIMATGYKSSVPSQWLKEGEIIGWDGSNVKWKGRNSLYPVGLSRKGLLGCAQDAVHVAGCIANREAKLRIISSSWVHVSRSSEMASTCLHDFSSTV